MYIKKILRRVFAASLAALLSLLLLPNAAHAEDDNLMDLSLEELLNMEVTSVSKKPENRREAPAAIYVITADEIRRSSATTIPDLLRTVPGVHVARYTSNTWSVSARGDSGEFSNKLLILIDGRSIYTPLFGGVFWNANDVMLEDVERIEVVRGPGGTLWGANAVNGVINIVTKHSSDTQGGLVTTGVGTYEQGFGSLRYGGQMSDDAFYRVYGKYTNRDSGGRYADPTTGIDDTENLSNDGWNSFQSGFRLDWNLSDDETVLFEGNFYNNNYNAADDLPFRDPQEIRRIESTTHGYGLNLLTRWEKALSGDSSMHLQAYINHTDYKEIGLGEERTTADIEFQHRFNWGSKNELVWGLGYRVSRDDIENTDYYIFNPDNDTQNLFSAFIQNEFQATDSLKLIVGTKIEHNDYTDIEIQPSARFVWTPNEKNTVWGSVSRAVRTPDRAVSNFTQIFSYTPGTVLTDTAVIVRGNDDVESEELISYELGFRTTLKENLFLDMTAFYNEENNSIDSEIQGPFIDPEISTDFEILQYLVNNDEDRDVYGFEAVLDWQPKSWWTLRAIYSYFHFETDVPFNDNYPDTIASLINSFEVSENVELDVTLRYVDSLSFSGVEDYTTADVRLGWKPKEDLEIALVGQNLFDKGQFEFQDGISFKVPTQVQRGFYGKVTWKF